MAALLALALFAGLSAARAPEALGAGHGGQTGLVLSSFELKGTNSYTVEGAELREGDFPPTVAVVAHRDALRANYEVSGGLEPGMHAVFGPLGRVAFDFHRQKRSVDRPEKGCAYITETGVFRGEFSFAGENGYTAAKAGSVSGEVLRLPNGFCGFGDDRKGPPTPDFLHSAHLAARSRIAHGFVQFEASALGARSRFWLEALVREAIGSMTITRMASVNAENGDVVLGSGKRPHSASVDPPPPFEGSASFREASGGPPTWTGSLRVSLPGLPDVALAGPDFAARVCPRLGLFGTCKVSLPPRNGGRARPQGSGSHSQPFADARLSWSR